MNYDWFFSLLQYMMFSVWFCGTSGLPYWLNLLIVFFSLCDLSPHFPPQHICNDSYLQWWDNSVHLIVSVNEVGVSRRWCALGLSAAAGFFSPCIVVGDPNGKSREIERAVFGSASMPPLFSPQLFLPTNTGYLKQCSRNVRTQETLTSSFKKLRGEALQLQPKEK